MMGNDENGGVLLGQLRNGDSRVCPNELLEQLYQLPKIMSKSYFWILKGKKCVSAMEQ